MKFKCPYCGEKSLSFYDFIKKFIPKDKYICPKCKESLVSDLVVDIGYLLYIFLFVAIYSFNIFDISLAFGILFVVCYIVFIYFGIFLYVFLKRVKKPKKPKKFDINDYM